MVCAGRFASAWFARLRIAALFAVASAPFIQAQEEKPKLPEPTDIIMPADDYVDLYCTYFPSPIKNKKEAVPVILVHGLDGRRSELEPFARMLQEEGHAVFVPDLRGHGESNIRKIPGRDSETLKPATLRPVDFAKMAATDFLVLKRELLTRNNAGEFNAQLLTVVGVELGSILAVNWAALDWSQPVLPAFTLGHDIKGLVLVSPMSVYKTAKARPAVDTPVVKSLLSIMLVAGTNDAKVNTEFKRFDNIFKSGHRDPKQDSGETDEEYRQRLLEKKTYYDAPEETVLQGVKLISAPELRVARKIAAFIQVRIVDRAKAKDLPAWEGERRVNEKVPGT